MDDNVWGNAWGTGDNSKQSTHPSTTTPSDWSSPGRALHDDTEADISIGGAWSPTAATFSWGPQPELQSSVWGKSEAEPGWDGQGFADIKLASDVTPPAFGPESADPEPEDDEDSQHEEIHTSTAITTPPPASPIPSSPPVAPEPEPTPSPELSQPVTPRAESPDGFGGFADAAPVDDGHAEAWPAPASLADPDDAWGSAWAPSSETDEQEAGDEWEAAKREKEQRDRRVPPEVLRAILDQCDELAEKMWPEDADDTQGSEQGAQVGMYSVPGFTKAHDVLLPDTPFPSAIKFSETGLSKARSAAVKATRHTPIARQSPLAHFVSGAHSAAWEASLRAARAPAPDVVPAGWRILETPVEAPAPAPEKRGGLLAFWGRRASTVPKDKEDGPKSPASPTLSSFGAGAERAPSPVVSPRASFASSRQSSGPSRSSTPTLAPALQSPPLVEPKAAQDFFEDVPAPAPAPSAVSRFLGRFSRTGSSTGRSSLALSSNDLDVLSDMVPSAADGDGDDDDTPLGLQALTNMIESKPVPLPAKLPPPLPAPARASTMPAPPRAQALPPPLAPRMLTPTSSRPQTPVSSPPLSSTSASSSRPPPPSASMILAPTLPPPLAPSVLTPTPSRAPTPVAAASMSIFALPPRPAVSALSPPPTTRAPTPVSALPPAPASVLPPQAAFDDDDDFADFHASPVAASPPPAAAFSQPLSFDAFDAFSSAPPPLDAFDDFDDFVGPSVHPSPAPAPAPSRARKASVALPSEIIPLGTSALPPAPVDVDFFADPFAQPQRAPQPQPHRTPAQTRSPSQARAPSQPQGKAPRRASKAAMLNLVEAAKPSAGRRWPAPPSPLAHPLAPPPGFRPLGASAVDLLGGDVLGEALSPPAFSVPPPAGFSIPPPAPRRNGVLSPPPAVDLLGASPAKPAAAAGLSIPPPAGFSIPPPAGFPPPPPRNGVVSPPPRSAVASPPLSAMGSPPLSAVSLSVNGAAAAKSGLSASDLSFFEGL